MSRAGFLNKRCAFYRRPVQADDGYGNTLDDWSLYLTVWGGLVLESGVEAVKSGRLESSVGGVLRVRVSTETDAITAADKVVINGETWAVISKSNRDQHDKFYEMKVEQGVAV